MATYHSKEKEVVRQYNSEYYRDNRKKIKERRERLRQDPVYREKLNQVRRQYYAERCRFLFAFPRFRWDIDKLSSWRKGFEKYGHKISKYAKLIVLEPNREWLIEDCHHPLDGYRVVRKRTGVRVFTIKKPVAGESGPDGPPDDSRLVCIDDKYYFLQPVEKLDKEVAEREEISIEDWIATHGIPHIVDNVGGYWLPEDVLRYVKETWKQLSTVISKKSKLDAAFRAMVRRWFEERYGALKGQKIC